MLDKVLSGDYCSGCGVCALVNDNIEIVMTENGTYKAKYLKNSIKAEKFVCPFSDYSSDETEISDEIFRKYKINHNSKQGYYLNNYAIKLLDNQVREKSSSGGVTSWLLIKLLELGFIDGVIHVKYNEDSDLMYKYSTSYSANEILGGRKSKYYPVEMSNILKEIRGDNKKYAVVGVPCFIKSIRLLCANDEVLKDQIAYTIGLICGHFKSSFFAESMIMEAQVNKNDIKYVDFRKKLPKRKAMDYGVELVSKYSSKTLPSRSFSTTNWGYNYFKYNACDYCDDVFAETADIVIGDAWLPEYENDWLGTNIVITRNKILDNIIYEFRDELYIREISSEDIVNSQYSGYKHKTEGLKYRLYLKNKKNLWAPKKRQIASSKHLKRRRKKVYIYRERLAKESFQAFKKAKKYDDFHMFQKELNSTLKKYKRYQRPPITKRIMRKINTL